MLVCACGDVDRLVGGNIVVVSFVVEESECVVANVVVVIGFLVVVVCFCVE